MLPSTYLFTKCNASLSHDIIYYFIFNVIQNANANEIMQIKLLSIYFKRRYSYLMQSNLWYCRTIKELDCQDYLVLAFINTSRGTQYHEFLEIVCRDIFIWGHQQRKMRLRAYLLYFISIKIILMGSCCYATAQGPHTARLQESFRLFRFTMKMRWRVISDE